MFVAGCSCNSTAKHSKLPQRYKGVGDKWCTSPSTRVEVRVFVHAVPSRGMSWCGSRNRKVKSGNDACLSHPATRDNDTQCTVQCRVQNLFGQLIKTALYSVAMASKLSVCGNKRCLDYPYFRGRGAQANTSHVLSPNPVFPYEWMLRTTIEFARRKCSSALW